MAARWWLGRRDEQLGDAGIAEPYHADLVVFDPRLGGDGLDHVVAIGELQRLEEVERSAGTTRSTDVDGHHGVAHGQRDEGAGLRRILPHAGHDDARAQRVCVEPDGLDPVSYLGGGRVRRVIARVLHDGRIGAGIGRAGQIRRGRQRRAIPGGDVAEALADLLVGVELLVGQR